jgi:hypothetical protein
MPGGHVEVRLRKSHIDVLVDDPWKVVGSTRDVRGYSATSCADPE